jgi:sugar-specific transcriptional regulator TrmB
MDSTDIRNLLNQINIQETEEEIEEEKEDLEEQELSEEEHIKNNIRSMVEDSQTIDDLVSKVYEMFNSSLTENDDEFNSRFHQLINSPAFRKSFNQLPTQKDKNDFMMAQKQKFRQKYDQSFQKNMQKSVSPNKFTQPASTGSPRQDMWMNQETDDANKRGKGRIVRPGLGSNKL